MAPARSDAGGLDGRAKRVTIDAEIEGRTLRDVLLGNATDHPGETVLSWKRHGRLGAPLVGGVPPPGAPSRCSLRDLAAEMATEARLLRAVLTEDGRHARARETAYRDVDPKDLALSLPGIADIGGPVVVAAMGDPARSTTPPPSSASAV